MLFEWYSGSDSSKEVPMAIGRYSDKLEELWPDGFSPEDRHAALSAILEKEQEPNWQAYLLFYIGDIYLSIDDKVRARPFLEQALSRFDIFASSFQDVRCEYANCLYQLLVILSDAAEEGWIGLALRAVAFVEDMRPTEAERARLFWEAGSALYRLAEGTETASLHRVARDWVAVSHHLRSESPGILKLLLYTSYGCEDDAMARRVYEMLEELDPDYEGRAELEAFVKKAGIAKT